jgi:hypothetical protein
MTRKESRLPIDGKTHVCGPREIVPQALRGRLGWNERHDRMAVRVMTEFKLILPRDRELIRQLAFMRVAQPAERSVT